MTQTICAVGQDGTTEPNFLLSERKAVRKQYVNYRTT